MAGVVDRRKTRQKMKVVELGLQNRLFEEMKKPSFTVTNFVRKLNDEGYDITVNAIRRFISKSKDIQRELIKEDLKEANNFKELALDYKKTIKEILDEVNEVKETCKKEKEYNAYSALVGRLYQGLELIAKLSGELNKTTQVDVKILYQEINNQMNTEAKKVKDKIFKDVIDVDSLIKEQDEKIARELRGE